MIEADNRTTLLNDNEHNDMISIMRAHHDTIIKTYPENSFQRIFWTSQYTAAQAKSPNGFRWNPAIIKWCIYLCHKSSSAYNLLRRTKILNLPSQRTLRQYTNVLDSSAGFSNQLDEQLFLDAKVSSLQEFQKYVGLIGDEMYIKEGLVYDKSTGKLVGYCDIGNINNHLLLLEKEYMGNDNSQTKTVLAKTMMVLMVRGLFMDFEFPYASFPTGNLTGEQMVPIFYEAILRIERSGLKVATITLDGNSVNRKYFKIVGNGVDNIKHKFHNPLSFNEREIYLFSDPPHLLKTSRNCLYSLSRHMEYDITTKSTGLTTVPKLKYENIYLTSYSKMRVDLAAEILSESVATALKVYLNEEAEETWLKDTFLKWLEDWENEAKSRKALKAAERKKLILSDETLLGLRITAYSFIDLVHFIFTIPGVKSFLSEHISQDPLEKYFGRQRQRSNAHENPTSQEFLKNNGALRVVTSIKKDTHRGNTQQHNDTTDDVFISPEPLKNKKKASSCDSSSSISLVPPSTSTNSKETVDLLSVTNQAIEDSGFNIPSAEAIVAKQSAIKLKEWMVNHNSSQILHNNILAYFFNLWISVAPKSSVVREQIWTRFSQFTSSEVYNKIWSDIYTEAQTPESPILSFYITYHYFTRLWQNRYPTTTRDTNGTVQTTHLSYDEESALWYIGGYLIRKVRRKIKENDDRDGLLAVLEIFEEREDMVEESLIGDDTDEPVDTQLWITLINRGGLIKCSNNFYSFLRSVELEIKNNLSSREATSRKTR
uniref:Transposable element P transposase-like RNase H domain-containing protein n=1 Tax=Amphimedon queenslandica TaxID=400682 RepID=A0A1X7VEP6_AMPQE